MGSVVEILSVLFVAGMHREKILVPVLAKDSEC
jgi:hypothetical protein